MIITILLNLTILYNANVANLTYLLEIIILIDIIIHYFILKIFPLQLLMNNIDLYIDKLVYYCNTDILLKILTYINIDIIKKQKKIKFLLHLEIIKYKDVCYFDNRLSIYKNLDNQLFLQNYFNNNNVTLINANNFINNNQVINTNDVIFNTNIDSTSNDLILFDNFNNKNIKLYIMYI